MKHKTISRERPGLESDGVVEKVPKDVQEETKKRYKTVMKNGENKRSSELS